ncbi:hypothetical protein D3C87_2091000 [compost metagenome]
MVDRGDDILPDQVFGRHFLAQIAGLGAHVAMGQLEPGAGEGVVEGFRIFEEVPGNLLVDGV